MKIAIDARVIYTSTGRYVERLLYYLQRIDHNNDYIVLLLKKDFDQWQSTNARFTKMIADYPPYSFREQIQFKQQLMKLQLDLVHFTMPQQPVLYRKPHVTTVHDLTLIDFVNTRNLGLLKNIYKNRLKPVIFQWAMSRIVRNSHKLITPTNYVKEQLIHRFGVPGSKVAVTYEAGDIGGASPAAYTLLEKSKFVLYVGNAYPYKNLEKLVESFQLLNRPDYQLVLVGKKDYFYEQLAQSVKQQQVKNVVFTGFVSDEELAWLYRHAAAFVFPSLSEGFGLPGLEAMAYGLPVLASQASCLPEVYGDAAHYFDPHTVADITSKLEGVLDNQELRQELIQAGTKRLKNFSWEKMARETLAVYRQADA